MAEGHVFDLVLFGFRNDVARARVLDYLHGLAPSMSGPAPIAADTTVPQRVFAGLGEPRARELSAALEALGAQVALVLVTPSTAEGSPRGLPVVAPSDETARSATMRPFTLLLAILLGGSVYLWRMSEPLAPRPARPPRETAELEVLSRTEAIEEREAVQSNSDAIHLAQSGEFREALDRLDAALRRTPDHAVLARNRQTVLLNWGIADLNANKLDDAREHLQDAAQVGDRPEVLRALGVTYLRQSDYAHAAPTLERGLEKTPADTTMLLALAEVYMQQDKRPQALDLLQRAKEAGVSGGDLEKRVQQLSREVDAEWDFVQLESVHFRVSFADSEDRSTVSFVLEALEEAYDVVGAKFDYYPDGRTPVVLYTQQDFHAITRTPDWAGGAFDGRIKIPVRGLTRNDPNLPRTARHEYAHSIVARLSSGRCPVWLNEGVAVWAEEAEEGERETWALNKIADQELFTLSALSSSFMSLPAARVEVAYAQSYLTVRSLIDRFGARKIPALLTEVGRAPNISEAFAAVYPADLAAFQEQLLHQLSGRS